jgi:frataxin-like iron-binding protein CyaY
MEEKDFQRIEQMIGTVVKAEVGSFKEEIKNDFRLQVGILSEDFHHKLQLVAEDHQMLSEKWTACKTSSVILKTR